MVSDLTAMIRFGSGSGLLSCIFCMLDCSVSTWYRWPAPLVTPPVMPLLLRALFAGNRGPETGEKEIK